jgi:ABC-type uncharacterized transport system substrate-binding protein
LRIGPDIGLTAARKMRNVQTVNGRSGRSISRFSMRIFGEALFLTAAAIAALGVLAPQQALAHPHVLIEGRNAVLFDDAGQIKALKVEWLFDEMYSAWAIDGLDANKNGTYEPDEIKELGTANVTNLKEYAYFTYATAKGQKLEFGDVTEYGITFDGTSLTLTMTLPFKTTVNPQADAFSFQVYDPTFYIYIGVREAAGVGFEGKAPEGCGFQVKEQTSDGSQAYIPDDVAMKPENAYLGAQFAETIAVVCSGGSAQTLPGTAG